MRERMRDAATATNIDRTWANADHGRIIGGYLQRPPGDPFSGWTAEEWGLFPNNKKLPIMVQSKPGSGADGFSDAWLTLEHLYNLRVPTGCHIALDLETAIDPQYVQDFGHVLNFFTYKVLVYGSTSTLFQNPPLQGYWVAAPDNNGQPYEFAHSEVVATQYALDVAPGFDRSTVKWETQLGKWWV